jgi:2,4-dienoyl-CoA reductase-like NADH-dependent reductase (Old Yellow Enzyme family)
VDEELPENRRTVMSNFKHLFKPIRIGPVEVPNRICHVPTDISASHIDGSVSDRDIWHHSEIAKGGTGSLSMTTIIYPVLPDWQQPCTVMEPNAQYSFSIPAARQPCRGRVS